MKKRNLLASNNQHQCDKNLLDQHFFCKKLLIQLDKEIPESNSVSIFQSGNKMLTSCGTFYFALEEIVYIILHLEIN